MQSHCRCLQQYRAASTDSEQKGLLCLTLAKDLELPKAAQLPAELPKAGPVARVSVQRLSAMGSAGPQLACSLEATSEASSLAEPRRKSKHKKAAAPKQVTSLSMRLNYNAHVSF